MCICMFIYTYIYIYVYVYIYIYIYTSVVTELAKYQNISDYGCFRPSIVSVCTFHADHFGIDGI